MTAGRNETADEWKERIGVGQRCNAFRRAASGPGSSQTKTVARSDKPGVAGIQVDHWDGRRDAAVFAESARLQNKTRTE